MPDPAQGSASLTVPSVFRGCPQLEGGAHAYRVVVGDTLPGSRHPRRMVDMACEWGEE